MKHLPDAVIILLGLLILPITFFLEARRKRLGIGVRAYTYGYFVGTFGVMICVTALAAVAFAIVAADVDRDEAIGTAILVVCLGIPGWYVIQRQRWAWVVLGFFSFNPIFWIIAYFYCKNRWIELNAQDGAVPTPGSGLG